MTPVILGLIPGAGLGQTVEVFPEAGRVKISWTIPADQRAESWGRFNFVLPEGFTTSRAPAVVASVNVNSPTQLSVSSGFNSNGRLVIGVARTNNAGGTDQLVTNQTLEASVTFDGLNIPADADGSYSLVAIASRTAAFDPDSEGGFSLTKNVGVDRFEIRLVGGGSIGEQAAGVPFLVRIRALDDEGSVYTPFSGTVELNSSTGELLSGGGETLAFVNGVRDSIQR